jgi:threonine dehydrogenase-like Zn-dependent dehydrogenase
LVELTGDSAVLETMLANSPPGATILLLGVPSAQQRFAFERIVTYDKTVVGSVGSNLGHIEEATRLMPELELGAYFQNVLPFARLLESWDDVRKDAHLKTLVEVDTR